MRKILATLLALALVLAAVPAMADFYPYEGDEITLRVMGWETYSDYKWDSAFGQWLKEKLGNVTIEMEIPASDTSTLLDLYLSSGDDMPDVFMYRSAQNFMDLYGDGSRSLNLLDYAEYMPEYMARREQFPHLCKFDSAEGACYLIFPCLVDRASEVWVMNQDLADKYGLEAPKTLDDMKACLETVYAGEGDDLSGLTFLPWGFNNAFSQIGTLFGLRSSASAIRYDYDKGEWVYVLTEYEDTVKQITEFMAEAYANKWLHPDFSSWEESTWRSYYDAGKWLFVNDYVDAFNSRLEGCAAEYTYITSPVAGSNTTPYVCCDYLSDNSGWCYGISATTKYPEAAAAFLELITSEEYAVAARWGIEGVTYTIDAEGNRTYTDEYQNDVAADKEAAKEKYGLATIVPYATMPWISDTYVSDYLTSTMCDKAKIANADIADKLASGEYQTYYGASRPFIDEDTLEDISVVTNAYDTYVSENIMNFVMGVRDLSEWDDFMAGLADYGDMAWVLEQYNTAEQQALPAQQSQRVYFHP